MVPEEKINGIELVPDSPLDCPIDECSLKVGVLTNPRSGGNKKGLGGVYNILAQWPEVLHREASTLEAMTEAISFFAQNGVDLIIINGGDGTVQAVLTLIDRGEIFSTPPLFALLRAGTTSMLPRDVGIPGSVTAGLSRALRWAKERDSSLSLQPRPILRVQRASGQPTQCGMFFGAGAICQGIKAFHSGVNPMGWRGQLMPGVTLLKMLLAVLRKNHETVPPLPTRSKIDDHPEQERLNLVILISTLDHLFFGMQPYWGIEKGPLRYTEISAEPKYLFRVIPSLFRWQKNHYATPANGYVSHNIQTVQLKIEGDFTLDGELYAVGEGALTITAAGPIRFLC